MNVGARQTQKKVEPSAQKLRFRTLVLPSSVTGSPLVHTCASLLPSELTKSSQTFRCRRHESTHFACVRNAFKRFP